MHASRRLSLHASRWSRRLLDVFTAQLLRNIERLLEMPDATAGLRFLKQRGVFVAGGGGFPLYVTQAIACHLGWMISGRADYVMCG